MLLENICGTLQYLDSGHTLTGKINIVKEMLGAQLESREAYVDLERSRMELEEQRQEKGSREGPVRWDK